MKGFFAKKNTEPKKIIKEYRVEKVEDFKTGSEIGLEILKDVKFIDVRSKTIGKGFAGVMKNIILVGLRASHGVSVSTDHMDQQGKTKILEKYLKEKKWLVIWGQNLEHY